jgi:hypothetical protein
MISADEVAMNIFREIKHAIKRGETQAQAVASVSKAFPDIKGLEPHIIRYYADRKGML